MDKIATPIIIAEPPPGPGDRREKVEQWRRENRHLIEAWNEWDATHPLLTDSDLP